MRRNRRLTKKNSIFGSATVWAGGILMSLLAAAMVYYFVDAKCTQLQQSIGREKNRLAELEKERKREAARWAQMQTRAGLEEALRRHGLAMDTPRTDQIVRVGPDGAPLPSQVSVMKIAKNRANIAKVAANGAKRPAAPAAARRR